jgi:hypothetical protein
MIVVLWWRRVFYDIVVTMYGFWKRYAPFTVGVLHFCEP